MEISINDKNVWFSLHALVKEYFLGFFENISRLGSQVSNGENFPVSLRF